MIEFVTQYWDFIVAILVIVVALIEAYKRNSIDGIRQMLFAVITENEEAYGHGMGQLKKAQAVKFVWEHIPTAIQPWVSEKMVESLIDKCLEEARGRWALNSHLEEYIAHNNEPTGAEAPKKE